ncbi:hypothetical protein DRN02_011040 [Sphingomonas paucimobilis]|uniref:hypothetical protein n=1 Tax=Sphingomonas paucimobilis TaxID=13689 RepID=UPI001023364F|nr:hypothetical protein [Sphingomonas paucimobilis]QBE92495.1 hypothetical protein DRN02_011040 [Sphingomonas paucimobilis]
MAITLPLALIGIGVFLWLLFAAAAQALPLSPDFGRASRPAMRARPAPPRSWSASQRSWR